MVKNAKGEEVKVFYMYVGTENGMKLGGSATIIVSAPMVEDPVTHLSTYDTLRQKVAVFKGGIFETTDKEIIQFLETYNEREPYAVAKITTEMMQESGAPIQTKTVEKKVMPLEFINELDITSLRNILDKSFGYTAKGETMKEIVEEGKEQGFFI